MTRFVFIVQYYDISVVIASQYIMLPIKNTLSVLQSLNFDSPTALSFTPWKTC